MRRTLAVMVSALTAAVLGLPGTAHAGPVQERYVVVHASSGSTYTGWFWLEEMEGIIGCEQCSWLLDLIKSKQLPELDETIFQQNLIAGLTKLSEAKVADDPRTAETLRQQAMDRFTEAARALGSAGVRVGVVGFYDPAKRAKISAPRAWLAAADQDLADGFTLLQRSFSEPVPLPWITAALAQFDEAYLELSQKKAIGS